MFKSLEEQIMEVLTATFSKDATEAALDALYGKYLGAMKQVAIERYRGSTTHNRDVFGAMDHAHCHFMECVELVIRDIQARCDFVNYISQEANTEEEYDEFVLAMHDTLH
tara:strand:- start:276 stop:605 length:330 start_codon:yes stop_codon:yes gene_type:complete